MNKYVFWILSMKINEIFLRENKEILILFYKISWRSYCSFFILWMDCEKDFDRSNIILDPLELEIFVKS